MKNKFLILCISYILLSAGAFASKIFIPMDAVSQANHLRAYGIAYAALQDGIKVDWLLNYKGGSYAFQFSKDLEAICKARGVSYVKMSNKEYAGIVKGINDAAFNGAVVKLEKAPKIAVYNPSRMEPWDDAVSLALDFAEIPYDKIFADDVLDGRLDKYDWLHLHHQDFTGQFGKFESKFGNAPWYQNEQCAMMTTAFRHNFDKVSQMQLAIAKKIRDFVDAGGNLFAMCSATETLDIALAAEGTDICAKVFDGDAVDPYAQSKLDYTKCFGFNGFKVFTDPREYAHSDIDNATAFHVSRADDNFTLQPFAAKFDPVPAMLCQNHATTLKGFMGQTTAFSRDKIKPGVTILAENTTAAGAEHFYPSYVTNDYKDGVRYLHGEHGKGTWTFYSGHDPEDYTHLIGNPATDLSEHPNSPGYRLILNNTLFPAAKRTIMPTVVINASEEKGAKTTATESVRMLNDVLISPNPTSGPFTVSLSSGQIQEVVILDVAGREVFHQSYHAAKADIDLKELTPGMYVMKVNGEYAGKVVKE